MLTPEQIQSMALSHGFYPDADFTQLVRAIERAARAAAIEECAQLCERRAQKVFSVTRHSEGHVLAASIRALSREGK